MRIIFVITSLIVCLSGRSNYIFDNSNGQVLGDRPYFDTEFVKNHKIKSIKGYVSTKASLDIIRPTNQIHTYEFDHFGQLIREYTTKDLDTIVTLYTYDSDGRITYIMKSTYAGFTTEHFIYDKKGRIIQKDTRREVNSGRNKLKFNAKESYEISSEKFEYVELENNNYKMLYYNKSGKIFKEEIYYFNDELKLISQEMRMIIGSARKQVKYFYDKEGRITEIFSESWIMEHKTISNKFEYDEQGRVMAKHYYKNGNYKTEYQILYDSETNYLYSILSRDDATDFITILKFTDYRFY